MNEWKRERKKGGGGGTPQSSAEPPPGVQGRRNKIGTQMLTDGDTKENRRCEGRDRRGGRDGVIKRKKNRKQASKGSAGDSDTQVAGGGGFERNTQTNKKRERG